MFTDVSVNGTQGIGIIFDGATRVVVVSMGIPNTAYLETIAEKVVSAGLIGASIGSFMDMKIIGFHHNPLTLASSTILEKETLSIAVKNYATMNLTIFTDSLGAIRATEHPDIRHVPGHGIMTPIGMKVTDRLSRKILRKFIKATLSV